MHWVGLVCGVRLAVSLHFVTGAHTSAFSPALHYRCARALEFAALRVGEGDAPAGPTGIVAAGGTVRLGLHALHRETRCKCNLN